MSNNLRLDSDAPKAARQARVHIMLKRPLKILAVAPVAQLFVKIHTIIPA